MDHGKVYVYRRNDKQVYALRWIDPHTNKVATRVTPAKISKGKKAKAEADRLAAELERQIFVGEYVTPTVLNWNDFVMRFNQEHLSGLAKKSAMKSMLVLDRVTNILQPKKPASITAERLSVFVAKLREQDCKDSTIKSYLAHLQATLNWAADLGLIAKTPKFPKIQRAARAHGSTPHKGRGITKDELDRMKDATFRLFGPSKCLEWRRYLEALWLSGLRLEESFALSWDEGAAVRVVIAGGRRKVARLLIAAEAQKSNESTLLPLSPDFSEWLLKIPTSKRTGKVFCFPGERLKEIQTGEAVGKKISELGKMAKVVVAQDGGKPAKYASAHDLRRSFGDRWADRVMPVVLRELMRHKSIETTLRFYVGKQAADIEATCRLAMKGEQQTTGAEKLPKSYQGVAAE